MSTAHVTKLAKTDPKFKKLVTKYGMPQAGPKDCTELNENDVCMMTACNNGKRIVMRCDGSGGCTRYSEEPCTDTVAMVAKRPARKKPAKPKRHK
jgi:hypothetical protein